jgi:hypothetical protein
MKKDPKVKAYNKFLDSGAYKDLKSVEKLGLPNQLEQLKQETSASSFLTQEAFLKNKARYETTPDFLLFTEYSGLSKSCEIIFYLKCVSSPSYINYQKIDESKDLARIKELRIGVESTNSSEKLPFSKIKKGTKQPLSLN